MSKKLLKPGNMLYPVPVVLVSCKDKNGVENLITVAWAGTICSEPPMLYISVRQDRFSHHMICETGEFVVNLVSESIVRATDFCGVKSGKDIDKWESTGLTKISAQTVNVSMVKESPVNIECKVVDVKKLGSHDMFIAEILAIHVDENLYTEKDKIDLDIAKLVSYSHGSYKSLGNQLGTFGYSVRKDKTKQNSNDKLNTNNDKCEKNLKCEVVEKCGACQYANFEYEMQLKRKQEYINDLLEGFAKVSNIIGMANPYHYRNKVHHVLSYDKKKGILSGSYIEGTHRVVNVENCLIEDIECQKIIKYIKELCITFKYKIFDEDTGYGFLRHVLVRKGFATNEIMVVLVCADSELSGKKNFVKVLCERFPNIKTIVLNVNDKKTSMVLGEYEKVIYGKGYIEDEILSCRFRISSKSFYQINQVQTEKLYSIAIEFAELKKGDIVLDTYCGIGTIGICVAKNEDINLIGIELNKDAVNDAKVNAKINCINNAKFIVNDATLWMENYDGKADVIFMDPPRNGSTNKFIENATKLNPRKIVYISCGLESLKRDLLHFKKCRYEVKKIQPVDMFPLTEHVETVVLMSRVDK